MGRDLAAFGTYDLCRAVEVGLVDLSGEVCRMGVDHPRGLCEIGVRDDAIQIDGVIAKGQ